MKTSFKLTAIAAIAACAMASCADNNDLVVSNGEGRVFLSTTLNSDVTVKSRSEVDDLRDNSMVWISNAKGVVYQFASASEIPVEGVRLVADNYVAEAWAGDSVPASFTDRYFYGFTDFSVANGDNKAVEITAKIANSVVAVNFDETVQEVLSDLSMTVGHSQGSLTFEGETLDSRGYFMMNSRDKDLEWTMTGTAPDGSSFTRSGKIEDCQPATLYTINVHCTESSDELGGAYFEITIDDTAIEIVEQIEISVSPVLTGMGFDLNKVQRAAAGEMGRKSIWIAATADITGLELSSDVFESMFDIPGGRFNFMTMADEAIKQKIIDGGINYYYDLNPETQQATVKLNFEEAFTNALPDGQTDINIVVTDSKGKSTTVDFSMLISAEPVTLVPVVDADVWASKATIKAVINKPETQNIRLLYREASASEWSEADSQVNGTEVVAQLTGLTPGTPYQFAVATDEFTSSSLEFTTEETLQVPNRSFEEWSNYSANSKVLLPDAGGEPSFWDTGNHGSVTMSKTVTEGSTDYVHSGEKSAKLKSQFVGIGSIGKFAAGNIFAGSYLKTDGTDGELGWGRPFTSRPKAVEAWVRYEPGTAVNKKGAGDYMPVGATDKGIIYAAIMDDQTTRYDDGSQWPCIVKTKSFANWQFNRDNKVVIANGKTLDNVIAFGQVIFEAQTRDEERGMMKVTIPFEYLRTDKKGCYLIFVASASLYGDYFQGGEGSTLYLDDINFIYE